MNRYFEGWSFAVDSLQTNRLKRLSHLLTLLSSGAKLSTPELAEQLNLTKRIIQLDFKEYLLPLFDNGMIYYDYSLKCYGAKTNFLTNTLLSSEELAVIALLKAKSKDKFSDEWFATQTDALFQKFEESLSNNFYQETMIEKIDDFKTEIIQIKNAITNRREIACTYNNKARNLYPLKILNLEGFWYLINYDVAYAEIRRYHLNTISDITLLETEFTFDEAIIEGFDNAINAFYEPHIEPFAVELFVDAKVAKYFKRKPISKTQRVLKTYHDGSCDIELYITDFMEIVPTIQRYVPYVRVIRPNALGEIVYKNLNEYLNGIK